MKLTWGHVDGQECLALAGLAQMAGDDVGADMARRVRVYPTGVLGAGGPVEGAVEEHHLQPVAGRYVVAGATVCFVPRFPFLAGTSYTMLVDGALALTLARPADQSPATTTVVEIYPTAREIPRNLLRLYVQFSAPMAEGSAMRHIHVVRADTGEELAGALLDMEPELWDLDRTRLTVLFDPARIKRGLAPHREAGYPLRAGAAVDVVVDEAFRDAAGRRLATAHRRRYEVGADVRERVEPRAWRLNQPAGGTVAPLVVDFDRPLDRALLERCLVVTDGRGRPVPGSLEVPPGEASWQFTPALAWGVGRHQLVVDCVVEDLAGNSVARVFDRELGRASHAPAPADRVILEFDTSGWPS